MKKLTHYVCFFRYAAVHLKIAPLNSFRLCTEAVVWIFCFQLEIQHVQMSILSNCKTLIATIVSNDNKQNPLYTLNESGHSQIQDPIFLNSAYLKSILQLSSKVYFVSNRLMCLSLYLCLKL